jgi:bacteriocin-like protein
MTDKKTEELNEQDLSNVTGGILSSGHGTPRNTGLRKDSKIKKPGTLNMERVHEDE